MSAWQRAPDDPTGTHRTAREEIGLDVGAGGTEAPAEAAFILPVFFPLLLNKPLGLDYRQKTRRDQSGNTDADKRAPRLATTLQSSLLQSEFKLLLVSAGNMPSYAIRIAIASSRAGNKEFLTGPIDRHGLTCKRQQSSG